jgi:transposase InsO family protein
MRKDGIAAQGKRKFKATTNSKHSHPVHPNLLARNFTVFKPNQVWTGDITYIRTFAGWLYLAVVIDLYSRKVVGWAMGRRINGELVVRALYMAIAARKPAAGLIFHSDRGSQYAADLFQKVIRRFKFRPSMSRKGDCWDNAPTESFFATLKKELIRNAIYITREAAMTAIFRYIEGYYNTRRAHSTLGYDSPAQFEKRAA